MPAILPSFPIDASAKLGKFFLPYQVSWIEAEESLHAQDKQAFALAEKSVRIGWTYADAFKNVRKRLRFSNRDYLFATKDYPSALEYMRQAREFVDLFNHTRSIVSHGEEYIKVPRAKRSARSSGFTDELKIGILKFDNRSRIIAFSAHPQAMAVYGGDVGLDEFAKHSNAKLLWETAQGRVTWGYDLAVWSAHDGEDTLFNQFAIEAKAGLGMWNLYFRVTMPDAIEMGLLKLINAVQGTNLSPEMFLSQCRDRARMEEIFQQSYLCNPQGDPAANIVDWSAIESCLSDYTIERAHLEADQVLRHFGQFDPCGGEARQRAIHKFIRQHFPKLLQERPRSEEPAIRIGFDVAASGQGDLAVFYIDESKGQHLWLRALFTCRTEDWHFIKTVLFFFLENIPEACAAGDESGLGRQICWEAEQNYPHNFSSVNFGSKKHDLGFSLMNQLSEAGKRFPRNEKDIASDFFALRKIYTGTKWVFRESRNLLNSASHCDIAWAGALATAAFFEHKGNDGPCAFVC